MVKKKNEEIDTVTASLATAAVLLMKMMIRK